MAATTAGGQQKGKSTDKNKKCFHSPSTSFLLIFSITQIKQAHWKP